MSHMSKERDVTQDRSIDWAILSFCLRVSVDRSVNSPPNMSKETHKRDLHTSKRDLQKRPNHQSNNHQQKFRIDQSIPRQICQKNPIKETYTRDLYTSQRDSVYISQVVTWGAEPRQICQKRPTKETYIHQKETYKRDLHTSKREWCTSKRDLYRSVKSWHEVLSTDKYVKRDLQKRPTQETNTHHKDTTTRNLHTSKGAWSLHPDLWCREKETVGCVSAWSLVGAWSGSFCGLFVGRPLGA